MGVLERENNIAYDEGAGKPIDIVNSNTSPMAITKRVSISSLLGGYDDFNLSINKVKSLEIKTIIHSSYRISSSRTNRKCRIVLLRYLDSKSKL